MWQTNRQNGARLCLYLRHRRLSLRLVASAGNSRCSRCSSLREETRKHGCANESKLARECKRVHDKRHDRRAPGTSRERDTWPLDFILYSPNLIYTRFHCQTFQAALINYRTTVILRINSIYAPLITRESRIFASCYEFIIINNH